ncbi:MULTISPECIES: hypothetical protein [unclassified Collinsella]|jgi:hypothetical protein|uniref:hypothetical protein n=1 Tax=unclassified Collinsella TaxID=2637548 RepID=UPI0011C1AA42|nr:MULTISPECIES: hypothetical protein [unclassified Collinsella]
MTNSATADQPVNLSLSSRSSVFFWMGFWVLFAKFFLQATVFVAVEGAFAKVLLLFGCAFLAFRVAVLFLEGHSSGLGIIGICLGTVSYVLSGESVLLTTSLLLTAAYEIDPQSILKCWSRAVTAIIVLMIWTYVIARLMGVTIGLQWSDIGGLSSNRSALFFIHPNYCAAVFFAWAMAMFCRTDVHIALRGIVGAISTSVIVAVAGSRTSAASLLLFYALVVVLTAWSNRAGSGFVKWVPRVIVAVPLVLFLFTLWISAIWFMGPNFSQAASDFLTGRPALWWAQWNYAGLTVFGHHAFEGVLLIRGSFHDIHTVDGMYASFLFNMGVAGFAWLLVLAWRAFKLKEGIDPIFAAALIAIFIFAFTEWHAVNAAVCAPLILLSRGMVPIERRVLRDS